MQLADVVFRTVLVFLVIGAVLNHFISSFEFSCSDTFKISLILERKGYNQTFIPLLFAGCTLFEKDCIVIFGISGFIIKSY